MDATNQRELNRQLNQGHGSFELVLSPVILALVGYLLDARVFHTTPLFTVIAAVLGVVGATVKLFYGYRLKMAELAASRPTRTGRGSMQ